MRSYLDMGDSKCQRCGGVNDVARNKLNAREAFREGRATPPRALSCYECELTEMTEHQ